MQLVILAAGSGSRFKPITNIIPKTLIPVSGEHLIFRILDIFYESVDSFLIVLNTKTGKVVIDILGSSYKGKKIAYVFQENDKNSGTMHSLFAVKSFVQKEEFFMVCNSDDLFDKKELTSLIRGLDFRKPAVFVSPGYMPPGYISIIFDQDNNYVNSISNKDSYLNKNYYANGLYLLNKDVFNLEPVKIFNGEIGLPQTLFANSANYNLKVYVLERWQSVNNGDELIKAEKFVAENADI